MAVNPVSATNVVSGINIAASQGPPAKPESHEEHNAGRDTAKNGDSDDSELPQVAAGKPTVNLHGHGLGSVIDTKA